MKRVLFLCTHNSARSQMAEGLLRHLGGNGFAALSAGTSAGQLHPLAIEAMRELGLDISGQQAKDVGRFADESFDFVITVCDQARDACPVFTQAKQQLHWSLPDPSAAAGGELEKLQAFRDVRDRLRTLIAEFVAGELK